MLSPACSWPGPIDQLACSARSLLATSCPSNHLSAQNPLRLHPCPSPQRLARVPLRRLVPRGFVFVFVEKQHVQALCRLVRSAAGVRVVGSTFGSARCRTARWCGQPRPPARLYHNLTSQPPDPQPKPLPAHHPTPDALLGLLLHREPDLGAPAVQPPRAAAARALHQPLPPHALHVPPGRCGASLSPVRRLSFSAAGVRVYRPAWLGTAAMACSLCRNRPQVLLLVEDVSAGLEPGCTAAASKRCPVPCICPPAGEGKDIELRHQRNPDVTFDCLPAEGGEPEGGQGGRGLEITLSTALSELRPCKRNWTGQKPPTICYVWALRKAAWPWLMPHCLLLPAEL